MQLNVRGLDDTAIVIACNGHNVSETFVEDGVDDEVDGRV